MTAEHMRRNVEISLAHRIDLGYASCCYRLNSINRPRHVLRVVESVVEIGAKLDLLTPFTYRKVFENREVEVLDRRQQKCVATGIWQRTQTRLNVLRVWIRSQISNDSRRIRNCAVTVFIEGCAAS